MINMTKEELYELQTKAYNGDSNAQLEFGLLFYKENINNEKAVNWITKAAEQGNSDALCYLRIVI